MQERLPFFADLEVEPSAPCGAGGADGRSTVEWMHDRTVTSAMPAQVFELVPRTIATIALRQTVDMGGSPWFFEEIPARPFRKSSWTALTAGT